MIKKDERTREERRQANSEAVRRKMETQSDLAVIDGADPLGEIAWRERQQEREHLRAIEAAVNDFGEGT